MNEMFSLRLRELRQAAGLSQKALAEMVDASQQTVAKWERGLATPNPETVAKLAQVLNTSTDSLLGMPERNSDIKFALWGGDADEISDEMLEDVKRYAKFIREQKQGK